MGIRIHKSIGYGFSPTPNDKLNIDEEWEENIYESDFDDYKAFLSDEQKCVDVLVNVYHEDADKAPLYYGNIDLFLDYLKNKARRQPHPPDFFEQETEHPESFILFYPHNNIDDSLFGSWRRYDDTIDYYENRVYKKQLESVVVDLSEYGVRGLHPYDSFMLLKPGRENKTNWDKDYMEIGRYNMLTGHWDPGQPPMAKDKDLLKHLQEDWAPSIPTSIKLFCHYYNVFRDPDTIFDMKPLLCQWWG